MRTIDSSTLLSVVAPIYNEAAIIGDFVKEVRDALSQLDHPGPIEIVLVNDGSTDGSGDRLDLLAAEFPAEVKVLHLARNFGHAAAVSAGLDYSRGDAVILMDSDMQDDPTAFRLFYEKWREGLEVVYALRTSRKESLLSRILFNGFYRILGAVADIHLPRDAGNFALMDRRVVDELVNMQERNRYLPGLRAWIGFSQTGVTVPRRERYDSSTRVGIAGLWRLAMNAIFSFSYVPLAVFRAVGFVAVMLSLILISYAVIAKIFFTEYAVAAWASQLTAISFFGGVNLIGLGVIGEYLARIYDEVKGRPAYIVARQTLGKSTVDKSSELIDPELATDYLNNREQDIIALRCHLAADAFEQIAEVGHRLKGSAASYNLPILGELARELEEKAHQQDAAATELLITEMEKHIKGARQTEDSRMHHA